MESESLNSARVLIVEDEALTALDLQSCVQSGGHQVLACVDSGEAAVRRAMSEDVDLILMDITLKGEMDGIDAARAIRSRREVPIIYLTAHADSSTVARAAETLPSGFLVKPYRDCELNASITISTRQKSGLLPPPDEHTTLQFPPSAQKSFTWSETSLLSTLTKVRVFSRQSIENLKWLLSYCSLEEYSAGNELFRASQDPKRRKGMVVLSGRAVLVCGTTGSKSSVVGLLLPNEHFGLVERENSPIKLQVRTQLKSEILWVPHEALMRIAQDHSSFTTALLEESQRQLTEAYERSAALARSSVPVRIADALLQLVRSIGSVTAPCTITVTRQDLADIVGTTVETAVRVTKKMEEKGIVDLSQRKRITILDLKELTTLSVSN